MNPIGTGSAEMPGPARSRTRCASGLLLFLIAVGVWIPGSDVVRLIAEQDPVLLGRYEENRVYLGLLVTPVCLIAGWILLSRIALNRILLFKALAVAFSVLVASIAVDIGDRLIRKPRYEATAVTNLKKWPHKWKKEGDVRTRPPNRSYRVTFEDEPQTDRSYPSAPAGFQRVEVDLTVDARGFRNPAAVDAADVIILGDSFAEGSRVDDAEVWGRRVEASTGRLVYNLAISGTSPQNYLNHLLAFGLDLSPKLVLCMIYEGNDLKVHSDDADDEAPAPKHWYDAVESAVKDSPVIEAIRDFVDDEFGSVWVDRPIDGWDTLSWMPLRIAGPRGVHFVSFEPKRLERLYFSPEEFDRYKGWKKARKVFADLKAACDEAVVPLVFVYAPSAPHVLLPLLESDLPAAGLRQFLGYEEENLPPVDRVKQEVMRRLDTCEEGFATFAASIGADVIRTTEALRAASSTGTQVYYTYDQHWTRHGHEVVAELVSAYLSGHAELFKS